MLAFGERLNRLVRAEVFDASSERWKWPESDDGLVEDAGPVSIV